MPKNEYRAYVYPGDKKTGQMRTLVLTEEALEVYKQSFLTFVISLTDWLGGSVMDAREHKRIQRHQAKCVMRLDWHSIVGIQKIKSMVNGRGFELKLSDGSRWHMTELPNNTPIDSFFERLCQQVPGLEVQNAECW